MDPAQEARHRRLVASGRHLEQALHLGRPRDHVGERIPGPIAQSGNPLGVLEARLAALQVVDGVLDAQHLAHPVGQQRRRRGADAEVGHSGLEAALDHPGVVDGDEQQHRHAGTGGRRSQGRHTAQAHRARRPGRCRTPPCRVAALANRHHVGGGDRRHLESGGDECRLERGAHVVADREEQARLGRLLAEEGHARIIGTSAAGASGRLPLSARRRPPARSRARPRVKRWRTSDGVIPKADRNTSVKWL